ncbi:hypothetical protein [Altericroceibacterium xinjiangense]|uniref:hypothetical protein n=1 Tax=Altericroceibacterium xinjiangense TaxID=762261 RepID=UPI000F7F64C6|nr:hypothetical protein [Altericroceibacterium xinjiangense]
MKFWRNVSPGGAASDFALAWRANPYRWRVLALSGALTFVIFWNFLPESQRVEPRPPQVTYITTWESGRSDAEILASNLAAHKRKEQRLAEQARREEIRKEIYRELGRATFIDVDAMEREIAEAEARDRAAAEAPEPTVAEAAPPAAAASIAPQESPQVAD